MLTLHHLNNSGSQRILWLLEELGVPYEIVHYTRNMGAAPPELKGIHPLGKSPIVTDGKHAIAESGAIMEYILETYGQGRLKPKPGTDEHIAYLQWIHYAEGSVMRWVSFNLIAGLFGEGAAPLKPFIEMLLAPHLAYIDQSLTGRTYLIGDMLSGADILMSFPLETAQATNVLGAYPAATAYLERIHARPAYQRALEKGGPFDLRL